MSFFPGDLFRKGFTSKHEGPGPRPMGPCAVAPLSLSVALLSLWQSAIDRNRMPSKEQPHQPAATSTGKKRQALHSTATPDNHK